MSPKGVAGRADGLDETWLPARFQLTTQKPDEDVQGVRGCGEVIAPDAFVEHRPTQDLARITEQELEQSELRIRQFDLTIAPLDLPRQRIQLEVQIAEGLRLWSMLQTRACPVP